MSSGRAANATYRDTQFSGCRRSWGWSTAEHRKVRLGSSIVPGRLLSVTESEAPFRRPVTGAIDITTVPCYGDVEGMAMVRGFSREERSNPLPHRLLD